MKNDPIALYPLDDWMEQLYLSELSGEGELPRWARGSGLYESLY